MEHTQYNQKIRQWVNPTAYLFSYGTLRVCRTSHTVQQDGHYQSTDHTHSEHARHMSCPRRDVLRAPWASELFPLEDRPHQVQVLFVLSLLRSPRNDPRPSSIPG